MRPSDIALTFTEAAAQLASGALTLPITTHPRQVARLLRACRRHGITPTAIIIGAGLAWGDRVALTDNHGTLTYAQLAGATMRAAAGLKLPRKARVGIMAWGDRFLLIALGAAGLNGASMCLLNPRLGTDDLASVVDQERLQAIIAAPGVNLRGYTGNVIDITSLGGVSLADAPSQARDSRLVLLTGGTTRAPSPIALKHRPGGVVPLVALMGTTGVRHGLSTLIGVPLFHGHGLICAVMCLMVGAPMVLSSAIRGVVPAELEKGGTLVPGWGEAMYAALLEQDVKVITAVPAQLNSLARFLDETQLDAGESPISIVSGSDRLGASTIDALTRRWGPVVRNYYGTTESSTVTVITGAALAARPTSVGRPVAGCRIRIVDEAGRVVPRGVTGRVQIWSPLVPASNCHTTNDTGWVDDDGYLFLAGRSDQKLRSGGEFVDLDAVAAVVREVTGVESVRAYAVPDETMGQRVAVEVTCQDGVDAELIRAAVRDRLGPASVPKSVHLVGRTLLSIAHTPQNPYRDLN